jgi:hypothetical protein
MGWNIGPANVVGSFFSDIYDTMTKGGFHDSEHYDRNREFDCHNKRIKKKSRRAREDEDWRESHRHSPVIDDEDYQYDRNDISIALQ